MAITAMSVEDEIRHTLAMYARVHDQNDLDGFLSLFTADGLLAVISGRRVTGQAALRQFIGEIYATRRASERRTKHIYANTVIAMEASGDRASVVSDVVAYDSVTGGPWTINMMRPHPPMPLDAGTTLVREARP